LYFILPTNQKFHSSNTSGNCAIEYVGREEFRKVDTGSSFSISNWNCQQIWYIFGLPEDRMISVRIRIAHPPMKNKHHVKLENNNTIENSRQTFSFIFPHTRRGRVSGVCIGSPVLRHCLGPLAIFGSCQPSRALMRSETTSTTLVNAYDKRAKNFANKGNLRAFQSTHTAIKTYTSCTNGGIFKSVTKETFKQPDEESRAWHIVVRYDRYVRRDYVNARWYMVLEKHYVDTEATVAKGEKTKCTLIENGSADYCVSSTCAPANF